MPEAALPPLTDRDVTLVRAHWSVLVARRREAIAGLMTRLSPHFEGARTSPGPAVRERRIRQLLALGDRVLRSSKGSAVGHAPIPVPRGFTDASLATLQDMLGDELTPAAFLAWRRFLRALAVAPAGIVEREALLVSWARLQFAAMDVAELFYAQMFALDHRYRRLCEHVSPQKRKETLMGVLAAIVAVERHPWFRCDAGFRRWAVALARTGLTTVDYDRAANVLLSTFAATLGESFSPAARAGWAGLLARVTRALARMAEHQSPLPTGGAAG